MRGLRAPQALNKTLTTASHKRHQQQTLYGKEKKSLDYVIGTMNLILHGVEAPNLVHAITLAENLDDIQPGDQHHVVLANPPFGGKERKEVKQNFPDQDGRDRVPVLAALHPSAQAGRP